MDRIGCDMASWAMDDLIKLAHKHCANHRNELYNSRACGCFYCCKVFNPSEIEDWCDEDNTAICPHCGIDAVIGDASGFPVASEAFLKQMAQHWF